MANNLFISGTAGDVFITGVAVAGIKTWRLEQTAAEIPIPHFDSATDALGRVWPDYLIGLSGATGTMEGYFNIGAGNVTDNAYLPVGIYATIKLYFTKPTISSWGFAVTALITSLGAGTNVENQPATFTANFRVTGAVPLSAVV